MSKRVITLVLALGLVPTLAAAAEQVLQFEFSPPDLARLDRPGVTGAEELLLASGGPALPMAVRTLRLPLGTRVLGLDLLEIVQEPLAVPAPFPVIPGRPTVSEGRLVKPEGPPVLAAADGWYPAEWTRLEVHGGLDPDSLTRSAWAVIRLFPIRTRLGSEEAMGLRSATVRLRYELPDRPLASRGEGMLIVAPEEFETSLQAFAAQRTSDGLATSVLTLEDILAAGTGRDDAESVKMAIAEQVETQGLLYVLLAGDADQLPIRYTHNRDFSGSSDWHDIACDLYFSDLYHADGSFSDWDGNADDLFGQAPAMGNPNPDGVDFLPDVVLGRIPASTLVELEGYLDKVSAYEASITGAEAWVQRTVLAGADTFGLDSHGDTSGVPEGEYANEVIASLFEPGTDLYRLYEGETYSRDEDLTRDTLAAAVEAGCGLLNFANHGSPHGWHWDDAFMSEDVAALTNDGMPPMVFGYACSTASFDEENPLNPGYPDLQGSFAESWVLKADGGALGYVGSTRTAFAGGWGEGSAEAAMGYLDVAYFQAVAEANPTAGLSWAAAQHSFIMDIGYYDHVDFITLLECLLLGDPAVRVGGLPEQPLFLFAGEVMDDSVGGDGDGCAEPGETVTLDLLILNDGASATGVAAGASTAHPDVTITQAVADWGDVDRGERALLTLPLELTIAAGAGTPQVAEIFLHLTWDGAPGTQGETLQLSIGDGPNLDLGRLRVQQDSNNDGRVGPGETVVLAPTVTNWGCSDATGLALSMSCADPMVTRLDCPTSFPTVAVGCTVCPGQGATLVIDPLATHGQEIDLDIQIDDGRFLWEWTETLVLVDRSMPVVDQVRVNPAQPEPGQEVTITARVRDGSGVAEVRALLYSPQSVLAAEVELLDDGSHGDGPAGDGIFGGLLTLGLDRRFYRMDIEAEDGSGYSGTLEGACGLDASVFQVRSNVLLVSDAPLDRYVGLHGAALADAGFPFDLWSWFRGCPTEAVLDQYVDGAVVWYCAHSFPLLDDQERSALAHYLDAGGSLLISEQDIGWELCGGGGIPAPEWYEDYLHATYLEDASGISSLEGVTGDPITNGMAMDLAQGSGANNQQWPSVIEPIAPARTILTYPGYSGTGAAAVASRHGTGNVVYLAFGLEGIAEAADRAELTGQALTWCGLTAGEPAGLPMMDSPNWWTAVELPAEEMNHRAVQFPLDGQVYLTPGMGMSGVGSELLQLDPITRQVEGTGVILPDPLAGLIPLVLEDPSGPAIYLMAGMDMTETATAGVYRFDPVAGTVEALPDDDWPAPASYPGSAAVGNRAYLFGGINVSAQTATAATWRFDPMAPAGSRWTELTDADLSRARYFTAGAELDGLIYAVGGMAIDGQSGQPTGRSERLDPLHPELGWERIAAAGSDYAIATCYGIPTGSNVSGAGTLVLAGGIDFTSGDATGVYRYDPVTDAWSREWSSDINRGVGSGMMTRSARGIELWQIGGIDIMSGGFDPIPSAEIRPLGAGLGEPWCGLWTDRGTYHGQETLNLFLALAEGDEPEPMDLFVVLEAAGTFLFMSAEPIYPTFTEDPAALASGFSLPAGFEWSGSILALPLPADLPELDLTWYTATVRSGTGELHGGLAYQPVHLMP